MQEKAHEKHEDERARTFISKDESGVWKYWLGHHYDGSTFIEAIKRIK